MINPPKAKDRTCGFVVNGSENGEPLPVRICDLRVLPGVDGFGKGKANALLIAAAPVLLRALEEIAERGPLVGYDAVSALKLRLVLTQSIARAAIAAARAD